MIFSRVEVIVPYSPVGVYDSRYTFRLPRGITAEKLSINSKDADLVVQIREGDGDFPTNPEVTEEAYDRGFSSKVYVTPISGFRMRCKEAGKTTRVSFTLYG